MRLPSLQQTREDAARTLKRFPFALACAGLGTLSALILIDHEGPSVPTMHYRVLFAAILGLPLFASISLIAERNGWSKATGMMWQVIGALLLAAYGFSVPLELDGGPIHHVQRLAMLAVGLCGLLLVGPYLRSGQVNGFWHYSKTLIFRVLLAGVYSGTLFAGLAIALAALENLFGLDIPGRRYAQLWVSIVGLFATWFFLAGIPKDLDSLEGETEYPKGLKVFAQYVLLPLMFVYLVILYAYLAKIVIEWNWPRGWVGGLTLSFAAAGIATLLLLHPIRERTENRWIKAAMRWFWVVMIPPIVMLILALTRRVSEYGLTEARYVGYALGFWLAAMALYFLFSRTKSIKAIPGSLALISLLISFGPWGAFHLSESSQVGRLEGLLTENRILVNGKVHRATEKVSPRDAAQISSIVGYLREVHGYGRIEQWFADSPGVDPLGSGSKSKPASDVTALMGVDFTLYPGLEGRTYLELTADPNDPVSIADYDHMLIGRRFGIHMPAAPDTTGDLSCHFDTTSLVLTMVLRANDGNTDTLQFPLAPFAEALTALYDETAQDHLPAETMSITAAAPHLKAKLCLRTIRYRGKAGQLHPFAFDADILYSTKAPPAE